MKQHGNVSVWWSEQATSWNRHVKDDIMPLRRLWAGGDALLSSPCPPISYHQPPSHENSLNTNTSEVTADTDHTPPCVHTHAHTHSRFPSKSAFGEGWVTQWKPLWASIIIIFTSPALISLLNHCIDLFSCRRRCCCVQTYFSETSSTGAVFPACQSLGLWHTAAFCLLRLLARSCRLSDLLRSCCCLQLARFPAVPPSAYVWGVQMLLKRFQAVWQSCMWGI